MSGEGISLVADEITFRTFTSIGVNRSLLDEQCAAITDTLLNQT